MNYIILDLEATCWEKRGGQQNETIEIGAVMVNEEREIVSEFNEFVKPAINPILSEFCMQLTSITQDEVDYADSFPEVIERFKDWFEYEKGDYLLCSWGLYDRNQFRHDCKLHNLDKDWTDRHISLKHQYPDVKGIKRPMGMKRALELEKFDLDGTHHRGIDDARNITKIFLKYFDGWSR